MLKLFQVFYSQYCSKSIHTGSTDDNSTPTSTLQPPPINFQSTIDMRKYNYFYFYERTLHIARNAEFVTKIHQNDIQRSPYNKQFFL